MKAKIKDGATVGQDMSYFVWTQPDTIFEVEKYSKDRVRLTAPGYGGIPYGNGRIYAKKEDIEKVTNIKKKGDKRKFKLAKRFTGKSAESLNIAISQICVICSEFGRCFPVNEEIACPTIKRVKEVLEDENTTN